MTHHRLAVILTTVALCAAGCATPTGGKGPAPITPTERYRLTASPRPEQIAFAPHVTGLSDGQRAALWRFYQSWADNGGEAAVTINAPTDGGGPAGAVASGARSELERLGVPAPAIQIGGYAAPSPGAPVLIAYDRLQADVPQCARSWTSLTATRNNDTPKTFGCAVTANMAAQIADPRDIRGPRSMESADAGRRSAVLEKYRKGELTGAKVDENAGKVSTAVQN